MMKQLPEHIKVGIKAMPRVNRDIYRKPEAFEAAVVETHSHFVGALAVLRLTRQGEKNIWKTIVDALKKNGSNEEAKRAQSEGGSSNNSSGIGHPDAHLLKLRSYIPCVGCGEKHRFTAKRNPKDTQYIVICPKYRNAKPGSDKLKELREQERKKMKEHLDKKNAGEGGRNVRDALKKLTQENAEMKEALAELKGAKKADGGPKEPEQREEGKSVKVNANRAATRYEVTVQLKVGDRTLLASRFMLDTWATICLFGDQFLAKLEEQGIVTKESLQTSETTYNVFGIHNTSKSTSQYIQADVYISETGDVVFGYKSTGVLVKGVKFYYLPGTKDVVVGRPVIEAAGLLPKLCCVPVI